MIVFGVYTAKVCVCVRVAMASYSTDLVLNNVRYSHKMLIHTDIYFLSSPPRADRPADSMDLLRCSRDMNKDESREREKRREENAHKWVRGCCLVNYSSLSGRVCFSVYFAHTFSESLALSLYRPRSQKLMVNELVQDQQNKYILMFGYRI
jgi:hypothetical protein